MIMQGISAVLLNPAAIMWVFVGTLVGILFGCIPGLTATMAIAMFLPMTYGMAATEGQATLMALYIGGISGGLISAILLNIPGTPASMATCLDGTPLARKGQAGKALGVGIVFSFMGTILSLLALVGISPALANIAIKFGPWEYFSITVFSLTLIITLSEENLVKGLGFHFRTVKLAAGDCSASMARTYDIEIQNFLKTDNIFMYFITLLFFITLISLIYISDRFGKAISGLKDFIVSADNHNINYNNIRFPNTELGEIGEKIIHNYQLLEESNKQINVEQEKLLRHFHYSDEGIAIFSANREKIYANTHFIQYLNIILDEPTFKVEKLLEQPDFKGLNEFLQKNTPVNPNTANIPVYQNKISKGGKHFAVKLLIFTDNSFEITLNNISDNEKNRLLKQEMTNNIAHELKTPVSSIRGYVETLLEQPNIAPDKQHFFLERTYSQIVRLSDLIRDIALITKTEEASELFDKEQVNVHNTLQEVINDLHDPIIAHGINVKNEINPQTVIEGNKTLVYAIFRNLIENSINYAGDNITIGVNNYMEDNEFYYFSYYDTGQGIEENHLNRIFERFYRVCEGRSRQNGGSGLGLSIVKNAILFHKGDISAKNRKDGGLEFLFSLKKTLF